MRVVLRGVDVQVVAVGERGGGGGFRGRFGARDGGDVLQVLRGAAAGVGGGCGVGGASWSGLAAGGWRLGG